VARFPIESGYLFVHLPKTAGTSFRDSLGEIFGDGLYCDYGSDETTSPAVVEYIHKRNAYPEFGSFLAEQNKLICLSGHYPIKKYGPFFSIKNIMLFLRDPIQRVISQYEHMKRVDGLKDSFEVYCTRPNHVNLQSRNIGRAPFNLIGFVGMQEFYRESLQLLSAQSGLQVRESFLNVNAQKESIQYTPDEETLKLIIENNSKDIALYKNAKQVFLQRYKLFQASKPYVHAAITTKNNQKIAGWAINMASESPVELSIYVNNKLVSNVLANYYRHDLREWNVGRQGYIGFDLGFKSPLEPNSLVECKVTETGQDLFDPFLA